MPTIDLHDLQPTGSDLFADTESYLDDLTDSELTVRGGYTIATTIWGSAASSAQCISLSATGSVPTMMLSATLVGSAALWYFSSGVAGGRLYRSHLP